MARSAEEDPLKTSNFIVRINGFARYGFKECSGLQRETEVVEYREGGDNESVRKSAGLASFSDITLRRGQVLDEGRNDFYEWARDVYNINSLGGNTNDYRRDIEIVQIGRDGQDARRWLVYNCWPKTFKPMGDLDATANEASMEELVLVNEGFDKLGI